MVGNINEWQHSAMYVAFLLSGVVDLVGFYMPPGTLPVGTEQVRSPGTPVLVALSRSEQPNARKWRARRGGGLSVKAERMAWWLPERAPYPYCSARRAQAVLSLAFVVEGTLFAFHLEGAALNVHAHLLLVLCIFAAAGALALEMRFPSSALLGALRAQLVVLQGIWFTQIARLLFEGAPAPTAPAASLSRRPPASSARLRAFTLTTLPYPKLMRPARAQSTRSGIRATTAA